jgi:hypothetical protein
MWGVGRGERGAGYRCVVQLSWNFQKVYESLWRLGTEEE